MITLEGIDGSGKSTIVTILEQYYKDDPGVVFTREPTGSWIGDAVHRAIASRTEPLAELFLFLADHADHLNTIIKPALEDNKVVISDRYSDSRYAYQGVTLQGIIENPLEWVTSLHKGWTVEPDFTILLDINPEIGITRVNSRTRQTKFEELFFLEQVRNNYLKLACMNPERFYVINAQQPLDKVEEIVLSAVKNKIRSTTPQ